jgi:predicted metal-dependent hydrolase
MSVWNEMTKQMDESTKIIRIASREKDKEAFINGNMAFYLSVNGKFNPGQNFSCEDTKIIESIEAIL